MLIFINLSNIQGKDGIIDVFICISLIATQTMHLFVSLEAISFSFLSFFFFVFLGPHLQDVEVPGLGAESELQLLAYATATAMPDLSHICNLHRSLWQHWILNLLSKARDRTHILTETMGGVLNPQWEHHLLLTVVILCINFCFFCYPHSFSFLSFLLL